MLRLELLVYSQLIGVILLLGLYDIKILHLTTPDLPSDPYFQHFVDFIKFNNSDQGIKLYLEIIIGLSVVFNFWGLISNRTILDLFITMVSVPFAFWYWTVYLPLEKSFITDVGLFNQLLAAHIVLGLFVWALFSLTLLGSYVNYYWEPIELIFVNVISGLLILDITIDLPVLINPKAPLTLHYGHITNGVGTIFIDYVVPGLIVALGLVFVYRLYQRSIIDFLLIVLFGVGGYFYVTEIAPLEEYLHDYGPSRDKQIKVGWAHIITFILAIFCISLKLTIYFGTLYLISRTPKIIHEAPKEIIQPEANESLLSTKNTTPIKSKEKDKKKRQ